MFQRSSRIMLRSLVLPQTHQSLVGVNPLGVTISPNGTLAYVSNHGSNTVSVINTATNTVTATIPVGLQPQGIAFTPNGAFAYIANENSNAVSVIQYSYEYGGRYNPCRHSPKIHCFHIEWTICLRDK